MTTAARRIAVAAVATVSPLAASAGVIARSAEGPSDANLVWHLLGVIAPIALWGLPLGYVVFAVASLLPRHPRVQRELEAPRDATLVDRLSLHADSSEGW